MESVHATHWPSRVYSTRTAELRKPFSGTSWPEESRCSRSERASTPRKKMRLPERAATGERNCSGPLVRRVGFEVDVPGRRQRSEFPPRLDWKMKLRLSAVQTPQHSEAGWLKLGSSGRGVWSEEGSCQSDVVGGRGSMVGERRR